MNRYTNRERAAVKSVVVDLNAQYIKFIKALFTNARIIIDRFHIVQLVGRALGNARISLMLTTTVLNLIFNLFFIVGLKLGVAGSAMGTVLAQLIGALLTLKLLDDKFHFAKCRGKTLNAKQIKNVLHIALPTTFQQFVVTFGGVLIQSFVNPFGREVIIGYVAILRIMNFFRIVLVGLAQTLTVYGVKTLKLDIS